MLIERLRRAYMVLVYLFLYVPIAVLIVFSFNSSKYATEWKEFTLDWYGALAGDAQLIDAALNSVTIAALAATVATVLGTLAAWTLHRYRFKARRVLQSALLIVIVSPDIVMGVALLILFILMGLEQGFVTLLVAHITFCLPFVAVTVASRLQGFDRHVIEAAQDLGAGEYDTFLRIILPMVMPAVAAGWLLSFTLSLDDVIISFFVTGPGYEILPLRIYSMVKLGVKPVVNALCAIMVGVTVCIVLTSQILLKEKR